MPIRPVTLFNTPGYSMVATGTIITVGGTSTITGWDAAVSTYERVAAYTPANTANMSMGPLFCDGTHLKVATSPDGVTDGGKLFFRSTNPWLDVGVALADFTSLYAQGGEAFYMNGAAFEFLPLNQPAGSLYIAATRSTGNVYNLVPVVFPGGGTVTGTITTDGTTGHFDPNHIVSWSIVVDLVTVDSFSTTNSSLIQSGIGLDGSGTALTVLNPDGRLIFSKGYPGGHLWGLTLADFSAGSPPGGEAGYFHGSFGFWTLNLGAPAGPFVVTTVVTSVGEPIAALPALRVHPNPAIDRVAVEYSVGTAGSSTVELFDARGRVVRTSTATVHAPGQVVANLDVSDLPSGLYFCRVQSDGGSQGTKVLVRR